MKTLTILILAALLCSCASSGRKIDQSKVDQIKKGETTREQVRKLIGSPDQLIKDSDGRETWIYSYFAATAKPENFIPIVGMFAGGMNMKSQSLHLSFDASGIVSNFTSTVGGSDVSTGLSASGADKAAVRTVETNKRPK